MSEIISNSQAQKELLKHMIRQLHDGGAPAFVRQQLTSVLKSVPYSMVVEAEQELINEGLPTEEVLKLCDIHTQVLDGKIDQAGAKPIPAGHPLEVMRQENAALVRVVEEFQALARQLPQIATDALPGYFESLKAIFQRLSEVDKHYRRKEYLLFPYLEKKDITGPPKVMWGKHDETRRLLKVAGEGLVAHGPFTHAEIESLLKFVLQPAVQAILDMTMKENEIMFPMAMDKLSDQEWLEIQEQTSSIGYCLYEPPFLWQPQEEKMTTESQPTTDFIQLPSGKFTLPELTTLLNSIPVDMTFVDKDDKVRWFSEGAHRIFARSRAILGRDVRNCHPPASVHMVEQILNDFKSGKADNAPFWIELKGRFVHIEYFALRDAAGNYLGTLEVSQDLTDLRQLQGEQRLLSYKPKK